MGLPDLFGEQMFACWFGLKASLGGSPWATVLGEERIVYVLMVDENPSALDHEESNY